MGAREVIELRQQLKKLATDLQLEYFQSFRPRFPYSLVWGLPKIGTSRGGIILLDTRGADKHSMKGLVIRSWETEHQQYLKEEEVEKDGRLIDVKKYKVTPSFQPGDIIVFTHHAGMPISDQSKDDFRLINEQEVMGTVDFKDSEIKKSAITKDILDAASKNKVMKETIMTLPTSGLFMINEIANAILKEWLVYPRNKGILDGTNDNKREDT
jgi:co-chaperonin GroES (HSP10)